MTIINLESGMPTVQQARMRLSSQVITAKMQGEKIIKIIHGYGSSGKGGAIKKDVYTQLLQMQTKGTIKQFVRGEDFSPFNDVARKIVTQYPMLTKDKDYQHQNDGITIATLK